ncbi:MAG: hypothetical protein DYG89_04285, partial [Caldilinea sp. CFX5]|nr:hypothetical protein [Caldilinea sp. CFX5]
MHKMIRIICYFLCALSVVACPRVPTPGAVDAVATTASAPQAANTIAAQPTETPAAVTETPANQAADTPAPTDTPQALPTDTPAPTPEPLFYNLPPATLTNATGLYASPNRAELIVPVPVPAGETVFVMGRNATGTHLRVVWNTGVGWVPVSFTSYNGQRDRMAALPVFEREPPSCAIPLTTQFGLNSTWTSDLQQRIAVIAALFRSRYGEFPASSLALVVNGVTVESSRRAIVEQGQFSLKDVVFSVPQDLQPGDTVGY